MLNLGRVKPGRTIRIPWGSYTGSTGASSAASNYAAADILIYKDGSTTERASTAGFTATTTFDSVTGINLTVIDLADNTTAGFFAAGSEYFVIVGPVTVDAQTVNFPIARFVIGMEGAIHETTIATLSSQTSFTLASGPAEDDALNGCMVYIHDVASAVQGGQATVLDYTGSTLTVTLAAGTTFTAAATDNVMFFPRSNVHTIGGTVQTGRDLGTSVLLSSGTGTGQVSLSSGAVLLQATQTGVTIPTVTTLTNLPAITANWLTAAGTAADFTTEIHTGLATAAGIADAVWDEALAGHVAAGSAGEALAAAGTAGDPWTTALPGAYGAGTAGKIVGDKIVASVTGAVGSVTTLPTIPSNWITAAGIAASALNGKGDWNIGKTGYALSTAGIQAIWDALTSALTTVGSVGKLIVDKLTALATAADISTDVWGSTTRTLTAGTNIVLAKGTGITGFNDPTVAAMADGVWDEAIAGHAATGSTGEALSAAGSAGDPWTTALPGAYGAGTAGKIIGDKIAASVTGAVGSVTGAVGSVTGNVGGNVVGSVASVTAGVTLAASAVTAIWGALTSALTTAGTVGKLIVDKITGLTFTVANQVDSNALSGGGGGLDAAGVRAAVGLASANLDTQLSTIDNFLDTEVAAILAIALKLDTALELDGAVYRLTVNALENSPIGAAGLDAAGVRAAVGLAAANLDTQLGDLPTNAELATALGTADDAVMARLGAPIGASISADIAAAKTQVAAIETDTQDIQGRLPAALTAGGNMKADTLRFNGVALTGNGSSPKFGI